MGVWQRPVLPTSRGGWPTQLISVGLMPTEGLVEVALLPDNVMVPMRSCLKRRVCEWTAHFGASAWATKLVHQGVILPFREKPSPYRVVQRPLGEDQKLAISSEVVQMLKVGTIRQASCQPNSIVSSIFCINKKGTDKLRPCLDLHSLNWFLDPPRFHLDRLLVVHKLIWQGDWTCSIDLSSAYWHIPLSRKVKRYFHFQCKGSTYQFDVLLFGVSVALWTFWKVLCPWTQSLRSKGIRVVVYLDNILIMADSAESCIWHTQIAASGLRALGFCLNQKKSSLVPSRTCMFLGVDIDTSKMVFSLPKEKRQQIAHNCAD